MDQPKQPQGNFTMNLNFRRNANKDAPAITGRISTPEEPEVEYSFSAFRKLDDEGNPYWIGPVDMNRSMRQALTVKPAKGTHVVSIRENGFKVFKELFDDNGNARPNPAYTALTLEEQKHEDDKPAYWGSWTRTPELPQLKHAAWERKPNRYGPWASGNTQHPLTKEEAAALARGEPPMDLLAQVEQREAPRRKGREASAGRAG